MIAHFRRLTLASAALAAMGFSFAVGSTPSNAQEIRAVVELFTSQGCSSCPPADDALKTYAARDDVLALGYHVDYWDYLGWKDTLGSAENTARQRSYAKAMRARSVYTPQAVVDGKAHLVGSNVTGINARFEESLPIPVSITKSSDRLSVDIGQPENGAYTSDVRITLVYFRNATPVEIQRGENAGKSRTYVNAVIGQQVIGMWKGDPATMEMPVSEMMKYNADNCAVLLQRYDAQGNPGEIVGAAILEG
ncbi:MAG: DUF1223 domain-containing protein [Pseudomonadota bacterium]